MRIDLLVPTRGRPDRFQKVVESAQDTADKPDQVSVWAYFDDDDGSYGGRVYKCRDPRFMNMVVGPHLDIMSDLWNRLYEVSDGDILWHGNDDMVFETYGWDTKVRDAFSKVPDGIACVYGDDGNLHDSIAVASFTTRKAARVMPWYLPPYFKSLYNDLWLTHVYRKLDRLVYLPDVLIRHEHHSVSGYEHLLDDTYRERFCHDAESTQAWQKHEHEIDDHIAELRKVIECESAS